MSNPGKFRRPPVYRPDDLGQSSWNADVVQALRELQELPILKGRMIPDTEVGTSPTPVKHGLGRVPAGMWVVNHTANTVIWQPQAPTKNYIYVQAGADIVVDLWVF